MSSEINKGDRPIPCADCGAYESTCFLSAMAHDTNCIIRDKWVVEKMSTKGRISEHPVTSLLEYLQDEYPIEKLETIAFEPIGSPLKGSMAIYVGNKFKISFFFEDLNDFLDSIIYTWINTHLNDATPGAEYSEKDIEDIRSKIIIGSNKYQSQKRYNPPSD